MKIGELAGRTGCLVETIRYYEQEGLLPPPLRNTSNNYRLYNHQHVERLTFILRCRALSMNLDEIRQLLKARESPDESCIAINEVIANHLQHVRSRLTELQALEKELTELHDHCLQDSTIRQCGILEELTTSSHFSSPLSENQKTHLSTEIHDKKAVKKRVK